MQELAAIGSRAPAPAPCPATGLLSRLFLRSGAAWAQLTAGAPARGLPRLLLLGDADQFSDAAAVRAAVAEAVAAEAAAGQAGQAGSPGLATPSLELSVWPSCDHFWVDASRAKLAAAGLLGPEPAAGQAGERARLRPSRLMAAAAVAWLRRVLTSGGGGGSAE